MNRSCFVCMTVFNGERFLKEAIESVLAQSAVDLHFCIVDDGSNDSSPKILSTYAGKYPKILRVITNPVNQGIGWSLTKALRCWCGEPYFAMIGQDDIWAENFLSSQIYCLENTDAVAVFSAVKIIDELGNVVKNGRAGIRFGNQRLKTVCRDELFLELIRGNFLCAASAVISAKKIGEIPLSEIFGHCNDRLQDHEGWLNLVLQGEFFYNQKTSICYRAQANNFSAPQKRWMQAKLETFCELDRVLTSDAFWKYIYASKEPASTLEQVMSAVWEKRIFSNPCKLLVVKLGEAAINRGLDTQKTRWMLGAMYQDFGLLTKAYRMVGSLPAKIPVSFVDAEAEMRGRKYLEYYNCFRVEKVGTSGTLRVGIWPKKGHGVADPEIILALQSEDTVDKEIDDGTLLLKAEGDEVQRILSFAEDKTAMFRNGIIEGYPIQNDLATYYENIKRNGVLLDSRAYKLCRWAKDLISRH